MSRILTLRDLLSPCAAADDLPEGTWPQAVESFGGDWYWCAPRWSHRDDPRWAYRGVTSEEFAFVRRTRTIQSTRAFSFAVEGTQFGRDAATALSYAQTGQDNPARTGRPVYVLRVEREGLKPKRDGYLESFEPVPEDRISRIWRFNPDGSVDEVSL